MRNPPGSVAFLSPGDRLPDPSQAREDGLVAVGGDLSVERLLEAYQSGLSRGRPTRLPGGHPILAGFFRWAQCMFREVWPGHCVKPPTR